MITVASKTPITCRNYAGKLISLPVDYLHRALGDGRTLQTMDGEPLTIESVGDRDMVSISTNYSSWHSLTVGPAAKLALWAGQSVPAGDAKGCQLLGEYGMYVVRQISRVAEPAYVGNFQIVGGIYVG
jgi:hypothetical protein